MRQYINLIITMLLGGLWHGANWTFVFWGALHGLALCLDKIIPKNKSNKMCFRGLNIKVTFLFVSFAWIFFRAENFSQAWQVVKGIFTLQEGIVQPFAWTFVAISVAMISTIIAIIRSKKYDKSEVDGFYPILNLNTVFGLTIFFLECGLVLGLAFVGEHPFVYFQF